VTLRIDTDDRIAAARRSNGNDSTLVKLLGEQTASILGPDPRARKSCRSAIFAAASVDELN